jgi:sugar O-acyltransferase (sialic acid O-acetyltransferase NeuD family)
MADIVIYGTGKIAEVIYRYVAFDGAFNVVAFTCDAAWMPASKTFHDKPIVAFEEVERHYPPARHGMLIAIGYHALNGVRAGKFAVAKAKGYRLESYVSSRAFAGDWLQIGENCIILDNVGIEPGTRLGNGVALWSGAVIGHHSTVGDHCWLAAESAVGGNATMGERCFVGLGASIGHDVTLGADCLLGAGARVSKSAGSGSVFIGRDTELFRLDSKNFMRISKMSGLSLK